MLDLLEQKSMQNADHLGERQTIGVGQMWLLTVHATYRFKHSQARIPRSWRLPNRKSCLLPRILSLFTNWIIGRTYRVIMTTIMNTLIML